MTTATKMPTRRLEWIDRTIAGFMGRWGHVFLRYALGIVFVWFGALKFGGDLSPAADLVERTVYVVPPDVFIPILAAWEVLIGLCLMIRPLVRLAILLLAPQMVGTFLPLVLLPEITWNIAPYAPTLEGQYIIKNLVIIGAAMVIGGTVRRESTRQQRL